MPNAPSLISAFVTLLATIGPVETAAIFISVTRGVHRPKRKQLAARSVLIASVVLVAFALFGAPVLGYLHVSMAAFRIAGGLLLFLQALTLTFLALVCRHSATASNAKPRKLATSLSSRSLSSDRGAGRPFRCRAIDGQAGGIGGRFAVLAMLSASLGLTYIAMRIGGLLERLGRTGADVAGRISGVLLAGLAVQFMLDGLLDVAHQMH